MKPGPALCWDGETWHSCQILVEETKSFLYLWDDEVGGEVMHIYRSSLNAKRYAQRTAVY